MTSPDKLNAALTKRGLSCEGTEAVKKRRLLSHVMDDDEETLPTPSEKIKPALQDKSFAAAALMPHMLRLLKAPTQQWTRQQVEPIIDIMRGCSYMDGTGPNAEAADFFDSKFTSHFDQYMDKYAYVEEELDPYYMVPLLRGIALPEAYTVALATYVPAAAPSHQPPLPTVVHGCPVLRVTQSLSNATAIAGYMKGTGAVAQHIIIRVRTVADVRLQ